MKNLQGGQEVSVIPEMCNPKISRFMNMGQRSWLIHAMKFANTPGILIKASPAFACDIAAKDLKTAELRVS